jgi:hypothetical protein
VILLLFLLDRAGTRLSKQLSFQSVFCHFPEVHRQENLESHIKFTRDADKSLARPTFRCILFDGENISFDASLVICINSTNIPPIMIINKIYEHRNLPGRAKDLSAPL